MKESFEWILNNLKRFDSWAAIICIACVVFLLLFSSTFIGGYVAGLLTIVGIMLWDREDLPDWLDGGDEEEK